MLKSNLEGLLEITCFKLLLLKNYDTTAFPSLEEHRFLKYARPEGYSFPFNICFRNAVSFLCYKVYDT